MSEVFSSIMYLSVYAGICIRMNQIEMEAHQQTMTVGGNIMCDSAVIGVIGVEGKQFK